MLFLPFREDMATSLNLMPRLWALACDPVGRAGVRRAVPLGPCGVEGVDPLAPLMHQSPVLPPPTDPGANPMSPAPLHPLAQAANEALEKDCPVVFSMLSARGKRFFFPAKGILAQGAE